MEGGIPLPSFACFCRRSFGKRAVDAVPFCYCAGHKTSGGGPAAVHGAAATQAAALPWRRSAAAARGSRNAGAALAASRALSYLLQARRRGSGIAPGVSTGADNLRCAGRLADGRGWAFCGGNTYAARYAVRLTLRLPAFLPSLPTPASSTHTLFS